MFRNIVRTVQRFFPVPVESKWLIQCPILTRTLQCVFLPNRKCLLRNHNITITIRKLTLTHYYFLLLRPCSAILFHLVVLSLWSPSGSSVPQTSFGSNTLTLLKIVVFLLLKKPSNYFPKQVHHFTFSSAVCEAFHFFTALPKLGLVNL